MTDEAGLEAWQSKFEEWVEFAKPLMPQGKAKEAFARYPWYATEDDPFARLQKPASETRFGLVTTGGYSIEGEQEPMRGYPTFGDETPQIRRIPMDVDRSKLKINHPGYDHKYAEEDINVNLPFDRLNELVNDGTIGSLSSETLVLMGLQPNVAPLIRETIPQIAAAFQADNVEAALLVPS
ncbi:MAG: glycine/sarcosine/betaine reductase selenoprotein B family protein [Gammaproteobacteria bacterium]|nr:glycine/sarcosine/betaine reductase selenoprotein B family protein [Gammaproteobacteria bacterium]MCZ6889801.1 glycine/sarcosine/betaine reductase selenoprotein B family protein [Gammaproteobacteria bacterium]